MVEILVAFSILPVKHGIEIVVGRFRKDRWDIGLKWEWLQNRLTIKEFEATVVYLCADALHETQPVTIWH